MLSVADLNALPYATNPFSQGMQADDFRVLVREHGESVRWWKSFAAPDGAVGPSGEVRERNGRIYLEQDVPSGAKVFLFQNSREVQRSDFSVIPVGQTMISCLPDEIELARGDRILALDRTLLGRCVISPSGQAVDALTQRYVASVEVVLDASGVLSESDYAVGENGIEWNGTPPTGDVAIEFRYFPLYEWQGENDRQAPLGSDGKRLPQIGPLRLVRGDEVG